MTRQEIVAALVAGTIKAEEGLTLLAALEPKRAEQALSCKVSVARPESKGPDGKVRKASKGGALSVYGLGRWPVTLYKGQWKRLIAFVAEITAFMAAHDSELSDKV